MAAPKGILLPITREQGEKIIEGLAHLLAESETTLSWKARIVELMRKVQAECKISDSEVDNLTAGIENEPTS